MKRVTRSAAKLTLTLALGAAVSPVLAAVAGIYAYPQAGQPQDLQARDEFECSQWAGRETGFDPLQPPPAAQGQYAYVPPPPPPQQSQQQGTFGIGARPYSEGGVLQDAAIGGALGALGGAIAGDAGKGAALGAGASLLFGGLQRLNAGEKQQYQQQPQYQPPPPSYDSAASYQYNQRLGEFRKAYGACMSARRYTVR